MITIQMIRWFVIWLLVFSVGLLLGSLALASTAARTAFLLVAIFGTQVAIAVGWIATDAAQLECELAKYVENHAEADAAKKLAEFASPARFPRDNAPPIRLRKLRRSPPRMSLA